MSFIVCRFCDAQFPYLDLVQDHYCPKCFHRALLHPTECDCPRCFVERQLTLIPELPGPDLVVDIPELPGPDNLVGVPELPQPSYDAEVWRTPFDPALAVGVELYGFDMTHTKVNVRALPDRIGVTMHDVRDMRRWFMLVIPDETVEHWLRAMMRAAPEVK